MDCPRPRRPFVTLLALVVALFGGVPARAQAPLPAVLVTPAALRPIADATEFVGRIEALERVDIRARVTGFLRERTFVEGQDVHAGELIFLIEHAPFEAEVAAQQGQLEGAQAALNNATLQVTRGAELVRTNALARSTQDQRVADQQVAAAQVSIAHAALQQARIQLGYTQIITPIDGRIGRATVTPGNVVGPDAGVLATIVRDDTVRVLFPVAQRQLLRLRRERGDLGGEGPRIRVRLADGNLYEEPGKLSFVNVVADGSTDSTLVQAVVPNPRRFLTDGQVVGVRVEETPGREALVVPQSGIQLDQAGAFVLVVGAGNRIEQKRVRLARGALAGFAVIEEGIAPGALVVTEGAQRARPGIEVLPRPAPELPAVGPVGPRGG